ncbi:uncharacterized protein BDR25DRAFT_356537 [Lindgomyces ingoldianus]|uniref:Uncharacterized protein n=1 Tax=Lindgomyces ingoldianus TaxID=673940 RepID=A0ACB6QQK4_9PLEO|nr:uncharacterized protein BDR25DRAFT_356537 [Lindgomyces ingoldianus]KAF2469294.1 hypothetical protein BDR25DRAFT_356537 [Lindgomyces ingoldianus]
MPRLNPSLFPGKEEFGPQGDYMISCCHPRMFGRGDLESTAAADLQCSSCAELHRAVFSTSGNWINVPTISVPLLKTQTLLPHYINLLPNNHPQLHGATPSPRLSRHGFSKTLEHLGLFGGDLEIIRRVRRVRREGGRDGGLVLVRALRRDVLGCSCMHVMRAFLSLRLELVVGYLFPTRGFEIRDRRCHEVHVSHNSIVTVSSAQKSQFLIKRHSCTFRMGTSKIHSKGFLQLAQGPFFFPDCRFCVALLKESDDEMAVKSAPVVSLSESGDVPPRSSVAGVVDAQSYFEPHFTQSSFCPMLGETVARTNKCSIAYRSCFAKFLTTWTPCERESEGNDGNLTFTNWSYSTKDKGSSSDWFGKTSAEKTRAHHINRFEAFVKKEEAFRWCIEPMRVKRRMNWMGNPGEDLIIRHRQGISQHPSVADDYHPRRILVASFLHLAMYPLQANGYRLDRCSLIGNALYTSQSPHFRRIASLVFNVISTTYCLSKFSATLGRARPSDCHQFSPCPSGLLWGILAPMPETPDTILERVIGCFLASRQNHLTISMKRAEDKRHFNAHARHAASQRPCEAFRCWIGKAIPAFGLSRMTGRRSSQRRSDRRSMFGEYGDLMRREGADSGHVLHAGFLSSHDNFNFRFHFVDPFRKELCYRISACSINFLIHADPLRLFPFLSLAVRYDGEKKTEFMGMPGTPAICMDPKMVPQKRRIPFRYHGLAPQPRTDGKWDMDIPDAEVIPERKLAYDAESNKAIPIIPLRFREYLHILSVWPQWRQYNVLHFCKIRVLLYKKCFSGVTWRGETPGVAEENLFIVTIWKDFGLTGSLKFDHVQFIHEHTNILSPAPLQGIEGKICLLSAFYHIQQQGRFVDDYCEVKAPAHNQHFGHADVATLNSGSGFAEQSIFVDVLVLRRALVLCNYFHCSPLYGLVVLQSPGAVTDNSNFPKNKKNAEACSPDNIFLLANPSLGLFSTYGISRDLGDFRTDTIPRYRRLYSCIAYSRVLITRTEKGRGRSSSMALGEAHQIEIMALEVKRSINRKNAIDSLPGPPSEPHAGAKTKANSCTTLKVLKIPWVCQELTTTSSKHRIFCQVQVTILVHGYSHSPVGNSHDLGGCRSKFWGPLRSAILLVFLLSWILSRADLFHLSVVQFRRTEFKIALFIALVVHRGHFRGIAAVLVGVRDFFLLLDSPDHTTGGGLLTTNPIPQIILYTQARGWKEETQRRGKEVRFQRSILWLVLKAFADLYTIFTSSAVRSYGLKFTLLQILLPTVPLYSYGTLSALILSLEADRFTWRMPFVVGAEAMAITAYYILFAKAAGITDSVAICYVIVQLSCAEISRRVMSITTMTCIINLGGKGATKVSDGVWHFVCMYCGGHVDALMLKFLFYTTNQRNARKMEVGEDGRLEPGCAGGHFRLLQLIHHGYQTKKPRVNLSRTWIWSVIIEYGVLKKRYEYFIKTFCIIFCINYIQKSVLSLYEMDNAETNIAVKSGDECNDLGNFSGFENSPGEAYSDPHASCRIDFEDCENLPATTLVDHPPIVKMLTEVLVRTNDEDYRFCNRVLTVLLWHAISGRGLRMDSPGDSEAPPNCCGLVSDVSCLRLEYTLMTTTKLNGSGTSFLKLATLVAGVAVGQKYMLRMEGSHGARMGIQSRRLPHPFQWREGVRETGTMAFMEEFDWLESYPITVSGVGQKLGTWNRFPVLFLLESLARTPRSYSYLVKKYISLISSTEFWIGHVRIGFPECAQLLKLSSTTCPFRARINIHQVPLVLRSNMPMMNKNLYVSHGTTELELSSQSLYHFRDRYHFEPRQIAIIRYRDRVGIHFHFVDVLYFVLTLRYAIIFQPHRIGDDAFLWGEVCYWLCCRAYSEIMVLTADGTELQISWKSSGHQIREKSSSKKVRDHGAGVWQYGQKAFYTN